MMEYEDQTTIRKTEGKDSSLSISQSFWPPLEKGLLECNDNIIKPEKI